MGIFLENAFVHRAVSMCLNALNLEKNNATSSEEVGGKLNFRHVFV